MKKHVLFICLLLFPLHFTHAAKVEPWLLPKIQSAAQPNLTSNAKGELILSWIERTAKGHRLQIATYRNNNWTATSTVSEGNNWFVNWADFPGTVALADGTLWAHYLVKSGEGTYAYDVILRHSKDNGKTWSSAIKVNDDGTKTEHGFVSLWPWSASEVAVAWLDGRKTQGASGHDHHQSIQDKNSDKVMTLRTAVFDAHGKKLNEWSLDQRTCDCCQTDAAVTDKGPIVIYRDRDPNEIRDIYTSRFINHKWTTGVPVAKDHWHMPACPVNGPAISAFKNNVWAAWYTGANNTSAIRLAYSNNSGENYTASKNFKQGPQIQGRVDITGNATNAWLLWTEESAVQSIWLTQIDRHFKHVGQPIRISQLTGRGKATGFARMQMTNEGVFMVWTDVVDGKPVIKGAIVR